MDLQLHPWWHTRCNNNSELQLVTIIKANMLMTNVLNSNEKDQPECPIGCHYCPKFATNSLDQDQSS